MKERLDAPPYTYLRTKAGTRWVAVPTTAAAVGATVTAQDVAIPEGFREKK